MNSHISHHINICRFIYFSGLHNSVRVCVCVDLTRVVYKYIYISTLALWSMEVIIQKSQAYFLKIVAIFIF